MATKILVKDAKAKLQSLLNELNEIDDNATFNVELDDNCGGSYVDDITKWRLSKKYLFNNEVWLFNW
jgi:hypothetical protein